MKLRLPQLLFENLYLLATLLLQHLVVLRELLTDVIDNLGDVTAYARDTFAKARVAALQKGDFARELIQLGEDAFCPSLQDSEALGDSPDILAIPVGNAGNITAYWLGFTQAAESDRASRHPRMWGFQAAGAAPIVRGEPVADPETVATAIRIGNPASWKGATSARDESEGLIEAVTDDEIVEAYQLLARREGLFVEPASAACVAGLLKKGREGAIRGGRAVAILTGNGLKDPDTAVASFSPDLLKADASIAGIERALGL